MTTARTEIIPLSPEERVREAALRERFAAFWGSAAGDLRDTYDTFIGASPVAHGVSVEAVDEKTVWGWWVRPAVTETKRAILYVHGGGYILGSSKAYRGFASQIVARTGVPALIIDYPLAPEATLPAGPMAALAAWRYLVAQGFEQIAIVGDSAGGGLSLVTLAELTRQGQKPAAGVVFSPWTDLTLTGASMTDPAVVDPLIGYEYLQDCAAKVLGGAPASTPIASPLWGDLRGLPPLLIQVGTDERLLDDARRYADRAAEAGVDVRLQVFEGMHHVFQLDIAHLESSRAALDHAAAFLAQAFAR